MFRHRLLLCLLALSPLTFTSLAHAADGPLSQADRLTQLDLSQYQGKFKAAAAIFDLNEDRWYKFNKQLCALPQSPFSTFKIFNTLAGLDSGVLGNLQTTYKWDGTRMPIKSWERDHDVPSAFSNSVVWYYRRLAEEIGSVRMQAYLDQADYGNRDISGGIDNFWLDSSFAVSPNDQVVFLKRLYRNELPFSLEAMRSVRSIMVDTEDADAILSGKTGSNWENGHYTQGWYVGHLEAKRTRLVFAFYIEGEDASGLVAREMVKRIFRDMKLLPE